MNEEPSENNNSNSSTSAINSTQEQQHADLQDSFGESFDDDAEVTDRLLHYQHTDNEEDEEEDYDDSTIIHIPQQTTHNNYSQVRAGPAVLPVSTDGVFANMSAKPESESNKLDETPPVRRHY